MLAHLFSIKLSSSKHRFFMNHILLIIAFAIAYYVSTIFIKDSMMKTGKDIKELSFWDCFYFSLVTQTTVGYGDIVPAHNISKLINILQLLTIYGILLIEL